MAASTLTLLALLRLIGNDVHAINNSVTATFLKNFVFRRRYHTDASAFQCEHLHGWERGRRREQCALAKLNRLEVNYAFF